MYLSSWCQSLAPLPMVISNGQNDRNMDDQWNLGSGMMTLHSWKIPPRSRHAGSFQTFSWNYASWPPVFFRNLVPYVRPCIWNSELKLWKFKLPQPFAARFCCPRQISVANCFARPPPRFVCLLNCTMRISPRQSLPTVCFRIFTGWPACVGRAARPYNCLPASHRPVK